MPVFDRVGRHVAACAAIVGQLVPVAWTRAAAHRRAVSGRRRSGAGMVLPIGLSCAACARVAYLVCSRGHSPRSYPTGARRASMDDGVVLLVGFQMRDFQRPDGLQGAGERVI